MVVRVRTRSKTYVGLGVGLEAGGRVQNRPFAWYILAMGNLTTDRIKELSEPGRYSDGGGLMLQISPSGGKSWLMRVQVNGRRRDIGLGQFRHVSLRDARLEAASIKKLAASGIDPLEERRKVEKVIPTFEAAAKLAHAELVKGWKTASTRNNGSRRLSSTHTRSLASTRSIRSMDR